MSEAITVETVVNAPIEVVWECWTLPEHIEKWAFAQDDWEASAAENDVRAGGKFKTRMSAKDKSAGFDFEGVYTEVEEYALIEYDMVDPDGDISQSNGNKLRHVKVIFESVGEGQTRVIQTFDPEDENSREMQKEGWQAILNNFKKYTEKKSAA